MQMQMSVTQVNDVAKRHQSVSSLGTSLSKRRKTVDPQNRTFRTYQKRSNSLSSYPTNICERRSGLQDVDEAYLRQNYFAKPFFKRNNMNSQEGDNPNGAGANTEPIKQVVKQSDIDGNSLRILGGTGGNFALVQNSSLAAAQASSSAAPDQTNDENQMEQQKEEDQQQQKQRIQLVIPQQQQTPQQQPPQQQHIQQSSPPPPSSMPKPQQQSPQVKAVPKRIQQVYLPVVGKTEMCTTCPNCRATIYLVRGCVNLFLDNQSNEISSGSFSNNSNKPLHLQLAKPAENVNMVK